MKAIDYKTYQNIEWHMHNLPRLQKGAAYTRSDVLYGSVGVDYNTPTGHSKHGDPTAQKGLKLADGCTASRWIDAIKRTYAYFDGLHEANVMLMFYFSDGKISDVAATLKVDRRSMSRIRDNVVYRCAMYAAADGLIKLDQEA